MSIVYKPLRAEQQRGNPVVTWYYAYYTDLKYGHDGHIEKAERPVVGVVGHFPSWDVPRWWKCV